MLFSLVRISLSTKNEFETVENQVLDFIELLVSYVDFFDFNIFNLNSFNSMALGFKTFDYFVNDSAIIAIATSCVFGFLKAKEMLFLFFVSWFTNFAGFATSVINVGLFIIYAGNNKVE